MLKLRGVAARDNETLIKGRGSYWRAGVVAEGGSVLLRLIVALAAKQRRSALEAVKRSLL